MPADATFRCGRAARWMPRVLGGSVLLATLLFAIDERGPGGTIERRVRQFVGIAGALAALVIVRSGGELRGSFRFAGRVLVVGVGRAESRLGLDSIERLDFAPPFSRPMVWLPATVLIDRSGVAWRVPALLDHGAEFVRELLERAARADLQGWAVERDLDRRMSRVWIRLWSGYLVAAGVVALGVARSLGR